MKREANECPICRARIRELTCPRDSNTVVVRYRGVRYHVPRSFGKRGSVHDAVASLLGLRSVKLLHKRVLSEAEAAACEGEMAVMGTHADQALPPAPARVKAQRWFTWCMEFRAFALSVKVATVTLSVTTTFFGSCCRGGKRGARGPPHPHNA